MPQGEISPARFFFQKSNRNRLFFLRICRSLSTCPLEKLWLPGGYGAERGLGPPRMGLRPVLLMVLVPVAKPELYPLDGRSASRLS